jgi:hypothetical protein
LPFQLFIFFIGGTCSIRKDGDGTSVYFFIQNLRISMLATCGTMWPSATLIIIIIIIFLKKRRPRVVEVKIYQFWMKKKMNEGTISVFFHNTGTTYEKNEN